MPASSTQQHEQSPRASAVARTRLPVRVATGRRRALALTAPRLPAVVRERLLPIASRSLAVAVAGFATEFVLHHALEPVTRAMLRPVSRPAAAITRTIVTEIVVIDRRRRV